MLRTFGGIDLWQNILKTIYRYNEDGDEEEVVNTAEDYNTKQFHWEEKEAYCSFYVNKKELTITNFDVGKENIGKGLGETFLKKFIEEVERKFNREFYISVFGPTTHALPFWEKMKRKGIVDDIDA